MITKPTRQLIAQSLTNQVQPKFKNQLSLKIVSSTFLRQKVGQIEMWLMTQKKTNIILMTLVST